MTDKGVNGLEPNFKWLWAAFSIAWALHVGYVLLLSGRTRKLERQISDLQEQLRQGSRHD
ncbi:MAG: CcmD family protein [Acidobacteriia bacterium]|nr:CcmD family protein [Terriglobia bacterium]